MWVPTFGCVSNVGTTFIYMVMWETTLLLECEKFLYVISHLGNYSYL